MGNSNERVEPFFYDFTPMVWTQIIIFAIGGLLVASVVKHTDSVQKGLANGMSVLTSAIMSMIIEPDAFALTWRFTCGGVLAVWLFFLRQSRPLSPGSCQVTAIH